MRRGTKVEKIYIISIASQNKAGSDCVRVLVGCKADLEDEREVTGTQGQKAAEEMESRYFLRSRVLLSCWQP